MNSEAEATKQKQQPRDQLALLRQARSANRKRRRERVSVFETQLRSLSSLVAAKTLALASKEEKRASKLEGLTKILQSRLTSLSLLYYRVVEAEKSLCARRLMYESSLIDQMAERMRLAERLGLLSLHIQAETRGGVVVKKLSVSHPQYLRCQRAATENVKKDFFTHPDSKYSGVSVESVWKIENRILLDTFQSAASSSDPSKVKGLFCGVPIDCLETLIVYGMAGRPKEGSQLKHAFQDTWYDIHSKDISGTPTAKGKAIPSTIDAGKGKRAVDAGMAIPFPRCFSRHSTLEEDRDLVTGEGKDEGDKHELEGVDSSVRFLALCRVMIGKILVTAKNSASFPPVTDKSYDSMYSPMQEEYKLLNSNHVLPEFLVQYRFKGKDVKVESGGGSAGGVFDIDLARPDVVMPKFDHKREATGDAVQFPMGRVSTAPATADERGSRGGARDGGGVSGSGGGGGVNSPDRRKKIFASSASYTDSNTWVAQRQNAAKQKAQVIAHVEKLFRQCQQSVNEIKIKTLFKPRQVISPVNGIDDA
jgi:hypothetical protein